MRYLLHTLHWMLLSIIHLQGESRLSPPPWPRGGWLEGFMTEAGNACSFRHFLLLPDGTLQSFAPGEVPRPFPGISDVVAISAGTWHILALKKDGTVWAWGRNTDRQLGNAALATREVSSKVPVQVTGLRDVIAISAKGNNSYALRSDGTVWAWGYGNKGMTGDGAALTSGQTSSHWSGRSVPVPVKGIHNAIAISGPMALLADSTVMTWGDGSYGRLGNGTTTTTAVPVVVKGLSHVTAISYREYGALALLADGTVWAWGANKKGQLGTGMQAAGDQKMSAVPVFVKGLRNVVAIEAHNVCEALLGDGTVRVWGWGAVGGMGSGQPGGSDINALALTVPGMKQVVAIKTGNGYGLALLQDGTVMGWGANTVATGNYHQSWKPVVIAKLEHLP